jgi:SAM-dependent methyltransferase
MKQTPSMKKPKTRCLGININSSRRYLEGFMRQAASSLSPDDRVLDAGAGYRPYEGCFKHARYHSTDHLPCDKGLSFLSDLKALPIEDASYGKVLCTQVLEHVPDPERVLGEFHRVLSPGGELWLTAAFYYEEHEIPNDFYRYTTSGLECLALRAGFDVLRLEWLEGYFGTLSYELRKAARILPLKPTAYGPLLLGLPFSLLALILKPLFLLLSTLFTYLDLHHKYLSSGHGKNLALVAVKSVGKQQRSDTN